MNNQNRNTNIQSNNICYCHQTRIHSWTNLWDYSAHSVQFNAFFISTKSLPLFSPSPALSHLLLFSRRDGKWRHWQTFLPHSLLSGWQAKALTKKRCARWRDERRAAKIDKGEGKKMHVPKDFEQIWVIYILRGFLTSESCGHDSLVIIPPRSSSVKSWKSLFKSRTSVDGGSTMLLFKAR